MKIIQRFFIFYFLLFTHLLKANESVLSKWIDSAEPSWKIRPLISVGDRPIKNHYRLVGVPDGLGAIKENNSQIKLYINHEIAHDRGITRSHGGKGAFVSEWTLDINSLQIISGEDLIKKVMIWNRDKKIFEISLNENINRLCSADLPEKSAFFNSKNKKGFDGRIFMSGEEDREGGRAFAHIISGKEKGTSYELPYLGKFSWENVVAHPNTKDKTIVMGMDDNKEGQIYLYMGRKQSKGNPVERAGLMYGKLFSIKVNGDKFELVDLENVSNLSGSELEKKGTDSNIARFKRPEDGAWDTLNPNVFYFTTTDKIDGDSEIIKLTFNDINHPEGGGSIESILTARDIGAQMFDNLTVSDNGKILINEDPGDHEHLASVWDFDPKTNVAQKIFEVKPEYFQDKSHPNFLTMDEEHSGIIDITRHVTHAPWYKKSERYFLGTLQIHKKLDDPELVEGGQLYLISGPK